jgi:predicted acylesterase/phospholipase RssA/CRP-like cAMP-binding protein
MNHETADVSELLDCLTGRLPALRQALLADPGAQLQRIELSAGQELLRKGEVATAVYVVAAGLLRATATREDGTQLTLSEFGEGELAGEMAILAGGGVYSASVSAAQDSVLVRVPQKTFERIATAHPRVIQEMSEGVRRRIGRDQLAVGLTRLFGPLHESVLRYVESRVQWVRLQAGDTLFNAGDTGRDLYFVLSGRLRALGAGGRVLSEMGRGESIGEIALLTGEPRTATVVAVRDSLLVGVSREAFEEIVEKYPKVMHVIAGIVVRRLLAKERASGAPPASTCIAVLAITPGASTAGFAQRLVGALGLIGPTLHLTRERVDAALNQPGIAGADKDHMGGVRLAAWLDEQESHHRFVVYEADGTESGWTLRCMRQADEILLVADARSDPEPRGVEKALLAERTVSKARQALILLHPDGARLPSGTARWLRARHAQRHFHVRLDRAEDFGRVARCLAGTAIGVVFGGGGARGLAHIGVIRALREAGVPIDMIGGTSMGAVIAGAFGMGYEWNDILEISRTGWLRHKPHKEYTLPFISLIRTRVLDRWAKEVYGETDIEDLWLSYYCVSCNLTTSEAVILDRGLLWKAVRASSSLPGVFVPVLRDGNVYVDGAIVNNLPGDIMRKRSCHKVIVIDVGSDTAFAFQAAEFPSPWRLLWARILPFGGRFEVPTIGAVLMRTTEVSSKQKSNEVKRDADLCLRPPIDEYGVLEFESIDQIVEVGYRYAQEKLAELRAGGTLPELFAAGQARTGA